MRKIILTITCAITLVVWLLGAAPTVRAQAPTPEYYLGEPITLSGHKNASGEGYWVELNQNIIMADDAYGVVYEMESPGGEGSQLELKENWSAIDNVNNGPAIKRVCKMDDWRISGISEICGSLAPGFDVAYSGNAHASMTTGVSVNYYTKFGWDDRAVGDFSVTVRMIYFGIPSSKVCSTAGSNQTVDILPVATVTSGSLQAYQTIDDPARGVFEAVIDVTMQATLPAPVFGSGVVPATINLVINNGQPDGGGGIPTFSMSPIKVTINGTDWYFSGYSTNQIAIPAGVQDLTIRVQATITGQMADHYTFPSPQLAYLALTAPLVNNGDTVICDGSFEWPPSESPWTQTNESYRNGRIGSFLLGGDLFNGAPSCGTYFYEAGLGYFGEETLSPVSNLFAWPGGTMYYKFRYRTSSADLFNVFSNWKGSPNVYLVDATGNFVMDLFGTNVYDPALDTSQWVFANGNAGDVSPGLYMVVLDLGYYLGDISHTSRVYFDDVAIGLGSYPDVCSDWLKDSPATITPAPTASATGEIPNGTPTITGTYVSPSGTPAPSETPRVLPSIRPSYTSTVIGTPRATSTMRASVTPRNTATLSSGGATLTATWAPKSTNTPWGKGTDTPIPGGSPTVGPSGTPTAVNVFDPFAWGLNLPPPDTIWNFTPGIGGAPTGLTGDGNIDCNTPAGWDGIQWIVPWLNWNFCRATSFITFGPSQQATVVAIPGMFTKYEPFGTIKEASDGITAIRTQVASYPWNAQDAAPGTGDTINPGAPLKGGNGAGPWDGNLNLHYVPASGGIDTGIGVTSFSPYCQSKASQILPGALAYGMCFVFGLARNIGLTPWMQFFINLASILMPIRAALGLVGMGGQISFVVRDLGGDASGYQSALNKAAEVPRPVSFHFGRRRRRS